MDPGDLASSVSWGPPLPHSAGGWQSGGPLQAWLGGGSTSKGAHSCGCREGLGSHTTVWEEVPQGVNARRLPSGPPLLLLSSQEEEVKEKKRTCLFLGTRWLKSSQ